MAARRLWSHSPADRVLLGRVPVDWFAGPVALLARHDLQVCVFRQG